MTPKQQRDLLALAKEMVSEFSNIWTNSPSPAVKALCGAKAVQHLPEWKALQSHRQYRERLDRLTKRKGKK